MTAFAYLTQARSFYLAAQGMDIRSRPLTGYYAPDELAKAWLTLVVPATTAVSKLYHGASDAFELTGTQYYTWSKERLSVHPNGVLAEIGQRTGRGYSVPAKTVKALADLLPYLCEAFEELEDSDEAAPRLLPLADVVVFKGTADDNGTTKSALWLRAEAHRGALSARGIAPSTLTARAKHFGTVLAHRQSDTPTHSYGARRCSPAPTSRPSCPTSGPRSTRR